MGWEYKVLDERIQDKYSSNTMTDAPKQGHILVVDDEPEVHAMLGKMLRREGYTVATAYNAEEAFAALAEKKPDLVILDIMMPKVSGIEVCNRLKAEPATRDILVLMISARDAQADRIAGLEHGADDYVAKPFHLRSLLRKIDHMLTKQREEIFAAELSSK